MFGNHFSIRQAINEGWGLSLRHLWLLIKVAFALFVTKIVLGLGTIPFLGVMGNYPPTLLKDAMGNIVSMHADWQFNLSFMLLFVYIVFALLVLFTLVQLGVTRVLLDLYERGASSIRRLFANFHLLLPYIGAVILLAFIMAIPGIIAFPFTYLATQFNMPLTVFTLIRIVRAALAIFLSVRFMFFIFALVDKNLGSLASLKLSWQVTQGSELRLIVFNILLVFIPAVLGVVSFFALRSLLEVLAEGHYVLGVVPAIGLAAALFGLSLTIPMVMLAHISAYKQLCTHAKSLHVPPASW